MTDETDFSVAILAGGLATRLRPITEHIPKALVDVAGRPFLDHQIDLLRSNGITHLVLCVGYLGHMLQEAYGDGSSRGVRIEYSFDGETLLGTGGALRKALPLLGRKFFVLYGDSYLPIDYREVGNAFMASGKSALMTIFKNEELWDTSNVWFENGRIQVYNKKERCVEMRYIDYGLSVFLAPVIAELPPVTRIDLADVLQELAARNDLAAFEARHRFYEIGSPAGLAELQAYLQPSPK